MQIEISKIKHGPLPVLPEGFKDSFGPDGSGLLHPITLRPYKDDMFVLVAGAKRLKVFIELGLTHIEAKVLKEMNFEEARIISLFENLRRYNLPWYEQVELEKELHELRLGQYGAKGADGKRKKKNINKGEHGWSQVDTARELGIALGTFSQDLQLASAIKKYPHLRNVQDKTTALKLIKQIFRKEEAERESLILPEFEMNQVLNGNCLEILKSLPNETFHACITDPPWLVYKDDTLVADESTLPAFKEVFRVLKHDSLLFMFVSTPDFILYTNELPKFGFRCQQYPCIWHKTGTITHGRRPWEHARDFEPILVAAKGAPHLTQSTEISAIYKYPAIHSSKLTHPNEKPLDLLESIVRHLTWSGGNILDPFAGSGVTLEAARNKDRHYIGIERNHKFYEQIVKRLERK